VVVSTFIKWRMKRIDRVSPTMNTKVEVETRMRRSAYRLRV